MPAPATRLYLVTPPALPPRFTETLAAALDAGDVACVQLRLKDAADRHIVDAARKLAEVCRSRDVALVVNDRPDLAVRAGADGVHIGQQDLPYAEARRIVGEDRIVGVTTHASRDLAIAAADAGADYVAFGSFFPTATKDAKTRASVDLLAWWHELVEVPAVAIGGITVANCAPLVRAGADFLAVSSGVWAYEAGAAAAVAAFNQAIEVALERAAAAVPPGRIESRGSS